MGNGAMLCLTVRIQWWPPAILKSFIYLRVAMRILYARIGVGQIQRVGSAKLDTLCTCYDTSITSA